MSFPWLFEESFELGTIGDFDSETDTETRLDIAHYSQLAQVPGLAMPYRGAYCMRVNLANDGTPADAYVEETVGFDQALNVLQFIRFMLWVSPNITMANADEFIILTLQSAGPVDEAVVVINFTNANGLRIGTGETAGSQFLPLTTNRWHAVELRVDLDDGVSNDGSLILSLDGGAATTVSALDQAAIAQARLGVIGQDAGTTAGYLLFDDVMVDDTQIYPPSIRFPSSALLTESGHAFVGPGFIEAARLMSGAATDNVLAIYDTDVGNTNDASKVVLELKNTANSQLVPSQNSRPIFVQRGCYVSLTGTNPRAGIDIRPQVYASDGALRTYGLKRTPTPGNV